MAQLKLSTETIAALQGRVIVRAEKDHIVLDCGKTIYLSVDEIENLNDHYESDGE